MCLCSRDLLEFGHIDHSKMHLHLNDNFTRNIGSTECFRKNRSLSHSERRRCSSPAGCRVYSPFPPKGLVVYSRNWKILPMNMKVIKSNNGLRLDDKLFQLEVP